MKLKLTRNYLFGLIDYTSFYDLYPGYSVGIISNEDYYFSTKKQAMEWASIVKNIFESFPTEIKVYRAMKLRSENMLVKDNLGESWSWERASAIEFAIHNGSNYLLSGIVNYNDIDWDYSLKAFITNSPDPFSNEAENELYIPYSEEVIKDLKIEKII